MLSMEEFATKVKEELEELTGTPVVLEKRIKGNGVIVHGLRKANKRELAELGTAVPVAEMASEEKESHVKEVYAIVYLDEVYTAFRSGCASIKEVAEQVIVMWEEEAKKRLNFDLEWSAEYIKENVCYRLMNFAYNKKLLEKVPFTRFLDLAMVYYVLVELDENRIGSMVISKEHLVSLGISKEELHEAAMVNTGRILGGKIIDMYDYAYVLIERLGMPKTALESWKLQERGKMYVGSNSRALYGAAVLAYPNFIQNFSKELDDSDLVIIGSSVNELIILPVKEEVCLQEIKRFVVEVNRSCLNWTEVLSDAVDYYDSENKEMRVV